jgi:uncharacterized protein
MPQRELEEITADECLALLGTRRLGRLVYSDDLGPVAVPVNYAMSGERIVIRVGGGAKQRAMEQPLLAFEVDHIDDAEQSGWSVIARGAGQEIPADQVPSLLHTLGRDFPAPWVSGVHNIWLMITPQILTGRRLGAQHIAPAY